MTTPIERIERQLTTTAIAIEGELASIPDLADRQEAARVTLEELLPRLTRDVKTLRAQAVAELKEGSTLREVGALLGMSTGRVDQILKSGGIR